MSPQQKLNVRSRVAAWQTISMASESVPVKLQGAGIMQGYVSPFASCGLFLWFASYAVSWSNVNEFHIAMACSSHFFNQKWLKIAKDLLKLGLLSHVISRKLFVQAPPLTCCRYAQQPYLSKTKRTVLVQHAICSNHIFKYINKLLIPLWSPAHSFPLLLWHPQTLREHCNGMYLIVLGQASKSWAFAAHQCGMAGGKYWTKNDPVDKTCLSRTQFSRCLSLQDRSTYFNKSEWGWCGEWLRQTPREKYSKHPENQKDKKNSLAFQDKYFKPCRYRTFAHRRLQNQCCSCNSRFPKSYCDSDDQDCQFTSVYSSEVSPIKAPFSSRHQLNGS